MRHACPALTQCVLYAAFAVMCMSCGCGWVSQQGDCCSNPADAATLLNAMFSRSVLLPRGALKQPISSVAAAVMRVDQATRAHGTPQLVLPAPLYSFYITPTVSTSLAPERSCTAPCDIRDRATHAQSNTPLSLRCSPAAAASAAASAAAAASWPSSTC
jgi:hypothetical protein